MNGHQPIIDEDIGGMRKYQLSLDEKQAQIVLNAVEFWMRIGLGQFEEVLDIWRLRCPLENIEQAEVSLDEAKRLLTGFSRGGSYGVYSPEVSDDYRVAYDLEQVIRHRLSWDRKPEGQPGNVSFRLPSQTGRHALATIKEDKSGG